MNELKVYFESLMNHDDTIMCAFRKGNQISNNRILENVFTAYCYINISRPWSYTINNVPDILISGILW